ncbi:hypothetical protein LZ24_02413 [Desulfobotulus alkaliphilus]|uniref:Uncharacterized protein n=1 Tax=Desulfobotulus alkaliphilus TaxID=622671 RepID=A0A562RIP7_9BACT|nr:hypothetical protein [Desulfobotulus alkaliphilus]TWI68938.1 hypothetical protein LZ24_02413 [Desulfobotulus alkaliphilus]
MKPEKNNTIPVIIAGEYFEEIQKNVLEIVIVGNHGVHSPNGQIAAKILTAVNDENKDKVNKIKGMKGEHFFPAPNDIWTNGRSVCIFFSA